jgi:uridine phosphorylase
MSANHGEVPPILAQKHYDRPSAFTPESLLREARRENRITGASLRSRLWP